MKTSKELRKVILEIRRKPYPIKDLIPLLDKAATELEEADNKAINRYMDGWLDAQNELD